MVMILGAAPCCLLRDGPDTTASIAEQICFALEHGAQEAVPHHRGSARPEAVDHVGRSVAILGCGGVRLERWTDPPLSDRQKQQQTRTAAFLRPGACSSV